MMAIKAKWYVRGLLGGLLLTLLATVTFNWVIDPFQVFGYDGWVGVNQAKSDKNKRFSKAYILGRGDFNAVILGTSRALRLNPQHPGFKDYRTYNAALDGGTIYESLRYLQHAQGVHPLRMAVVGLDYFSFSSPTRYQSGFDERRLMLDADGNYVPLQKRLEDYGNALLSLDALQNSWRTFRRSRAFSESDKIRGLDALGFGEANQGTLMKLGGHRQAALIIEKYCISKHGLWLGVGYDLYLNKDYGFLARSMKDFDAMLRFAHKHRIDLKLYISPIHTRTQVAMRYVGVEPAWELWKRMLIATNEAVALELGERPFDLWDFASVNAFTTEPIPRDPAGVMQWYEETSHFRAALGDQILNVLLNQPQADELLNQEFGAMLRSGNVDAYLVEQQVARDRWAASHVDDVRDVVDQARHERTLLPGIALPAGLAP
ncbi:MAG TPA: hypothetical protein VIM96_04700 [Pseudomonadales bacterium]